MMSSSTKEPIDLLDLKLLPAWVKEPAETGGYQHYTGEEEPARRERRQGKGKRPTSINRERAPNSERRMPKASRREVGRDHSSLAVARPRRGRDRKGDHPFRDKPPPAPRKPLEVTIRFLPYSPALENAVAQIKSDSVAYSLFALARLFLEKPERYEVRVSAKAESVLYRLGENGGLSPDREFLERNAFRLAHRDFYKIDITQSEPIKGNFSNVARCRLSGTLLGPTNHHNYQPQLRNLYEQRFSRRMSFADYQRQVEIVGDPALVERWKEEAQKVTTYTTVREETPSTFTSAAEAERHFRSNYLPGLVRNVEEVTIGGVLSRTLPDRALNRAIEEAWARENRSPSNLMQELAARFRQAGVHVFRHRRGMLFVSPIRPRPFLHEQAGVSLSVNAILEAVAVTPRVSGKDLFEKLIADPADEGAESRKLALASDLRWLINEGYVIQFNDGSLDLPRAKAKPQEVEAAAVLAAGQTPVQDRQEQIAQVGLGSGAEIGGG